MKRFILIILVAVLCYSCQQERRYEVDFVDRQVSLQLVDISGLGTTWAEGDIVYFSDDIATRPGYQYKVSAGSISTDRKILNATYESAEREAGVIYALRGKLGRIHLKKTEEIILSYDGTLGGSGVYAGTAPVGQTILMNQLLPIVDFTYSLKGISSVRITADEKIFPEKIKYDFEGNNLTVVTSKNVVEIPVSGLTTYYFSLTPGNTAVKLTFTFLSEGGQTLAESSWSGSLNALPGRVFKLGTIDSNAENVIDSDAPELESAADAVKSMGIGVNNAGFEVLWKDFAAQADRNNPAFYETQNGSGLTTQATMNAYAEAGFKCVRIPVTWWPHMDNVYDATIDKVWLDRIEEVVGYCQKAGLYCIINVHHDAHAHDAQGGQWIYADTETYNNITKGFQNVWKQIALRFKNYDEKVLFEGYNEITDVSGTWTFPKSADDIEIANKLNQDFVNTVRKTGGNNVTRNLVVSSYSCSVSDKPLKAFVMPSDIKPGHLIWQVHNYAPSSFCSFNGSTSDTFGSEQDYADIQSALSTIKRLILNNGWPCIIGEYGSPSERQAQTQQPDGSWRIQKPEEERAKHAYYYTLEALKLGVVPIYWYNPMDGPGRTSGTWKYPILKDSIIKAWNDYKKL